MGLRLSQRGRSSAQIRNHLSVSANGVPLERHAQPFHDPTGRHVRRPMAADDAVEADALEGFISKGECPFGRISLMPDRGG
jgi:hypothetical protein